MAKIVVGKLGIAPKNRRTSIATKKVVNRRGEIVEMLTVDAHSDSFSTDLHSIFKRNVAKARRENIKRFGSADRVGGKG